MSDLTVFQSDALKTADDLKEVAAALHVQRYFGAEQVCLRAARLIREYVLAEGSET